LNKLLPLVAFSILLLVPVGAQNAFATDEDNVIFDGGRSDFDSVCPMNLPSFICAEDFKLQKATNLRDVHLDVSQFQPDALPNLPTAEFIYKIYADSKIMPGTPGVLLQEGEGINEHKVPNVEAGAGSFDFRYWFDLDDEIFLQADTTYWLQLEVTNIPRDILNEIGWTSTTPGFENGAALSFDQGSTWQSGSAQLNLVLTGGDDEVVGGEFLPIDSAALLLAAAQSPVSWLATLTIAALGIGAYVFSRNPSSMRNIKVILRDYLDRI